MGASSLDYTTDKKEINCPEGKLDLKVSPG